MTTENKPVPQSQPLLEVCVESFQDAQIATKAGAGRIEYCSALALGGLTPTPGAMERIGDIGAPCMVMIRPRPGNFCYHADDVSIMKREIARARDHGAAGVVFGACNGAGGLDVHILQSLLAECRGLKTTLHRAFDQVADQVQALSQAIDMGFDHILTSGGAPDAQSGRHQLAQLRALAQGRIGILPGAGINAANAQDILRATGGHELHASCKFTNGILPEDEGRTRVDPGRVRALCAAMTG
ncbi:copper homeostasis protein CutC [Thalassospira lucentensis]|uniref:copper homeostasis protein CutC n=1 Tax=Thalassospira lucentensis TaxID=168935 RepID=UPI003D2EABFB